MGATLRRESRRVCERINTSKDLWYREPRRLCPCASLPLSLSLSLFLCVCSAARARRDGRECAGECRTVSPAASRARAQATGTNGLHFVFCNTGRPCGSPFSRAPTHLRSISTSHSSLLGAAPSGRFRRFPLASRRNNAITQRPSALLFRAHSSADR
jgi:hypothetical protein